MNIMQRHVIVIIIYILKTVSQKHCKQLVQISLRVFSNMRVNCFAADTL